MLASMTRRESWGRGKELQLSQDQIIAGAFDQWITGVPGRIPDHTIFLENAEHASYANELAGSTSVVFVLDGEPGHASFVPVSGLFNVAGEELLVDGTLSLEIQDYVAIPFVNLVGVTIVRMTSQEDWLAFLDDADEARQSGHFVRQLTDVNAVLAERALLNSQQRIDPALARLHIRADGSVLSGPYGSEIGHVGDPLSQLQERWLSLSPESDLAAVLETQPLADSIRARPWIGRYLTALDAWKFIPQHERADTKIVGFGATVYGAAPDAALPPANAPFLIDKAGERTLLDIASGRRFKIGTDAAAIIEALLNTGDIHTAGGAVAPFLGVSVASAEEAAGTVAAQFRETGLDLIGSH